MRMLVSGIAGVLVLLALFHTFPTRLREHDPGVRPAAEAVPKHLWGLNSLHLARFNRKLEARRTVEAPPESSREAHDSDTDRLPEPWAYPDPGWFPNGVTVELGSASAGATIRYTTDGSIPGPWSRRYRSPVSLTRTTSLRFRSFHGRNLASPVVTQTYFIDVDPLVTAVSLTMDPIHLWNKHSGIHVHPRRRGSAWEREGLLEYIPSGHAPRLAVPGQVRIHGNISRRYPKRSFRFTYPAAAIEQASRENVLALPTPEAGRTVVLHAGGNNHRFRLRNELLDTLYRQAGGQVAAYEPVVLYLNGQPWGIYNLRERIDLEYLRRRVGEGAYDLIKREHLPVTVAVEGDLEAWSELLEFFRSTDLSQPAAFEKAAELIDLENFTDYWLFNIYTANLDWPHNNVYAYRSRDGADRRWRWISWDGDFTFNCGWENGWESLEHDTLAWATREHHRDDLVPGPWRGHLDPVETLESTLIAAGLLRNDEYRGRFVSRLLYLLGHDFVPERIEDALDGIIARTARALPEDLARWNLSEEDYRADVEAIRRFIRGRPAIVRRHLEEKFGREVVSALERSASWTSLSPEQPRQVSGGNVS